MGKDFYTVLQVSRGASAEEIRSAYRRRAMELHPDKSGADSEGFVELQEAYAALSDQGERAAYERGPESIRVRREVEPSGSFREVSLSDSFETFAPSFDELFGRLWSNFDLLTRPKAERLESLTVDVPLTADEALAGGSIRVLVPARIVCPNCKGHGAIGYYQCWRCLGQGAVTAEWPVEVTHPARLLRDHVVRLSLDNLGIHNFYLTVRFRSAGAI